MFWRGLFGEIANVTGAFDLIVIVEGIDSLGGATLFHHRFEFSVSLGIEVKTRGSVSVLM